MEHTPGEFNDTSDTVEKDKGMVHILHKLRICFSKSVVCVGRIRTKMSILTGMKRCNTSGFLQSEADGATVMRQHIIIRLVERIKGLCDNDTKCIPHNQVTGTVSTGQICGKREREKGNERRFFTAFYLSLEGYQHMN